MRRFELRAVALSAALALLAACAAQPTQTPAPQPPVAPIHAYQVQSPNGMRIDNYYWLRDDTRTKPEVLDYLKAENAYYAAMTAHTQALEDTLYNEIIGRIKQDDATVPAKFKHYFYYTRFEEGREYPIYARKHGSESAAEEILIDANALAQGHNFFQIGAEEISPNENLLAYAEDTNGRRQFTIRIKDLATGKVLPDEIKNTPASMAWAQDNKTLFYVENYPITLLTVRVRKHVLGSDSAKDPVVYEERDHSYYMGVGISGDDKYIVVEEHSTLSSELRFIPSNQPKAKFKVFAPREHDLEYHAEHIGNRWIVRTNWLAKNFRVMQVDDAHVGDKKAWRDLVPASNDVFISSVAPFRNYLAIGERSEGLQRILIKPWKGGREFFVKSDDTDYTATIGDNREQDTDTLRYDFSSLATPNSVYDLDMASGERTLRKRDPVLGGYDPANYATERVWAPARDGTKIPV